MRPSSSRELNITKVNCRKEIKDSTSLHQCGFTWIAISILALVLSLLCTSMGVTNSTHASLSASVSPLGAALTEPKTATTTSVPQSSSSSAPAEREEDLVLHTWAFCKAKPSPAAHRSPREEEERRSSFAWRQRASFVALDCGEDSFFVAEHHKAMGVADGVGGWRELGVDPSNFSNALMSHAKRYTDAHPSEQELDPQKIMAAAHQRVLAEGLVKAGSSTACVATLRHAADGSHELDVANLGDSGLIVVRDRKQIFRARENTHGFNTPYQLAVLPSYLVGRSISDKASDAVRHRVAVREGDVIVMGTDGLFDNSFSEYIAQDAGWISSTTNTTDSPLSNIPVIGNWLNYSLGNQSLAFSDPYRTAERLVMDAVKNARNTSAQTPWSAALRRQGAWNAAGGKPDDVTVLLGRISKVGKNCTQPPEW